MRRNAVPVSEMQTGRHSGKCALQAKFVSMKLMIMNDDGVMFIIR